jgi:thioredoxin reductase
VAREDRWYQWYDWNSLLADEPKARAIMPDLMDGTSSFPSRPEMEANLAAFAERAGLAVRYDCRWEGTRRDGDRFVLTTTDGEYRCQVAIFAIGIAEPYKPDTPGFDAVAHYVDTRPAESYAGKRLFIVGKENSGFELATGLLQWAQRIVLASPRPAKLSVNTHSLLGVRARYVLPFEDQNLGGGVFILNASIERIERTAGGAFRVFCIRSEDGTELGVEADEVIAATGFVCPLQDLPDLGVAVFGRSNLPAMTNYYESATVPGIYFAGTIGQGVSGMKKYGLPANSGAVHGARYNARTMVQHMAATHFGVELPRPEVKPDALVDLLLAEATRAPELWNQKSYIARAFSLDASRGIRDEGTVPLAQFVDEEGPAAVAIAVETDDTGDIHPAVYVRETGRPAVETLLAANPLHDFRSVENRAHLSSLLSGATAGAVR